MAIILAILGGLFTAKVYGFSSIPLGLILGGLVGVLIKQGQRLSLLEEDIKYFHAVHKQSETDTDSLADELPSSPEEDQDPWLSPPPLPDKEDALGFERSLLDEEEPLPGVASSTNAFEEALDTPSEWVSDSSETDSTPSLIDALVARAKAYFTGGNMIVRVGLVVLFFGIAFLLKYASDNSMLPIEFRLVGVAIGAIAMLLFGWRLRDSKESYALALQGGAVGILYLTVFTALRLYTLLPSTLAFGLLLLFVLLSALLALLQNSRSLAVLATAGGFMAPILTSTGEGSHVALFSYYLLLNAGVLAVAWFRSWRVLNLVGFGFTFVIGSLWGYQYYQPAYFSSSEPFLIAFFLLYTAIAVLFALRQPPNLRGLVDGTLVFGVPVATAGLQAMLVRDTDLGLAFSALAMGGFYISLAYFLFQRGGAALRLLSESFLAIGIVFATVSIPFAFDGKLSSAFWALEGAAMVWIGLRQSRLTPRLFGYVLQLLAALFYLDAAYRGSMEVPVLNSLFLGAILMSLSALFSSFYLWRQQDKQHALERPLSLLLFVWGMFWWFSAGIREIYDFVGASHQSASLLSLLALTALAAQLLKDRINWVHLKWVSIGLLPALVLMAIYLSVERQFLNVHLTTLGWLLALSIQYWLLYRNDDPKAKWFSLQHGVTFWLLTYLVTLEVARGLGADVGNATLAAIPWGLVPMLAMLLLLTLGKRLSWPVNRYYDLYRCQVIAPISVYLLVWVIFSNFSLPGSSGVSFYIPIINPLELTLLFCLLAFIKWWQECSDCLMRFGISRLKYFATLGGILFLILNGIVVRAVHHWADVPFVGNLLFASQTLQAAIAILWGSMGLVLMLSGSRLQQRKLWLVGVGMMGLVVAKLFFVDLSNTGTFARILSFICVGLLLLVVGYFSPAPPRETVDDEESV